MPKINKEGISWVDNYLDDATLIYKQRAHCRRYIKEYEIDLRCFFDGVYSTHYRVNASIAYNLCVLYCQLSDSYQMEQWPGDFKLCDKARAYHFDFDAQLMQFSEKYQWQLSTQGADKLINKISQLRKELLTDDAFDEPFRLKEMAKLYFQLSYVLCQQQDENDFERGGRLGDGSLNEIDSKLIASLQELQIQFEARSFLKSVLGLKRRCDELSPFEPGENSLIYQKIMVMTLELLEDNWLDKLAIQLHSEACTNLINGLWLCHLSPEIFLAQFKQKKVELIEATRLISLHHFIEDLFLSFNIVMKLKGKQEYQDKLLHGSNLPDDIKLPLDEDNKSAIIDCIKELMLQAQAPTREDECVQIVDEMRQSFKYRFDPNRFIDALMSLGKVLQRMEHFGNGSNSVENVQRYFSAYYSKLSSQKLLIFFRHFQGHDLNYLMSSLQALSDGHHFEWMILPEGEASLTFFKDIYLQIDTLMQLLRNELALRMIETSQYRYQSPREHLSVRKRNQACLHRLVNIYLPLHSDEVCNEKLEALFDQLK